MTETEFRAWYYSQIKAQALADGLVAPTPAGVQSLLRHDYWNAYRYGDTVKVVYIKSAPAVKRPQRENFFDDLPRKQPPVQKSEKPESERFKNSISRSKARIFELAICNEFTYFCTFTQDKEKRNRFDIKEFRKDLAQLVRNINRNRPENEKIKYLMIPEQHKNGAWHIHGLFMGLCDKDLRAFTLSEKLPQNIRKQLKSGEKVFDWARYSKKFGYFTCTEIKDHTACSKYITKYISKDLQQTIRSAGEHLFFASQGLKGREVLVKNCIDKCPFAEWDFENEYVMIKEIPLSDVPFLGH